MPYGISIQLVLRGGGIKYKKKKEGRSFSLAPKSNTHHTHTLEGCYNHMRVGCVSDVTLKCIKWRYHFFSRGWGGLNGGWVEGGSYIFVLFQEIKIKKKF